MERLKQRLRFDIKMSAKVKGLSTKDIAEKSGLTERCIDYILSGKRGGKLETLLTIYHAIGYNAIALDLQDIFEEEK